jgi:hypothetical protein
MVEWSKWSHRHTVHAGHFDHPPHNTPGMMVVVESHGYIYIPVRPPPSSIGVWLLNRAKAPARCWFDVG